MTAGSLSYQGVASSGNEAKINGNDIDISSAGLSLVGGGTSTEWIGFLFNEASGGTTPGGYAVLAIGGAGVNGPSFGMLYNQNVYGIYNNTSPDTLSARTTAVTTTTTFFVAKLNFSTGEEYLFLNPSTISTPSTASAAATLAMSSAFKTSGFDQVTLAAGYNSGSFNIDSVRIGTRFADVVPEPSSYASLWRRESAYMVAVRGLPKVGLLDKISFLPLLGRFYRGRAFGCRSPHTVSARATVQSATWHRRHPLGRVTRRELDAALGGDRWGDEMLDPARLRYGAPPRDAAAAEWPTTASKLTSPDRADAVIWPPATWRRLFSAC